jgi:hypothetical protein
MVDPDDFARPMVYDPDDDRWQKSGDNDSGRNSNNNQARIRQFCK